MIVFDDVTKRYAGGAIAVNRLSLVAPTGKLTVLVGPSGCGKTTSLRMVNRLVAPTSGTISLDGEPTAAMDVALLRRRIGYVIQHAGLFPHRTVLQNIATTARLNGMDGRKARAVAQELIERVGLPAGFAGRLPLAIVGRPAAAGRCRPRARLRSEIHADGRAVQRDRSRRAHPAAG